MATRRALDNLVVYTKLGKSCRHISIELIMKASFITVSSPYKKVPMFWVLTSPTVPVKNIQKQLKKYLRNLPKKEDTKAKRVLVSQINKQFQKLTGTPSFYLSIWNTSYYKVVIND